MPDVAMKNLQSKWVIGAGIVFIIGMIAAWPSGEESVDFSTEIKPILNKHCIACHGGVKKNGGFSLLFEEEAFAATESGHPAIIPGDAEHSEFIKRRTSDDPEERMPYDAPPSSTKEIQLLTRWVEQGAKWGERWAYTQPKEVKVPRTRLAFALLFNFSPFNLLHDAPLHSDIDYFIHEKHGEQKLAFSPQADRATLLRRVSLDLIGRPPSPEQVEAF